MIEERRHRAGGLRRGFLESNETPPPQYDTKAVAFAQSAGKALAATSIGETAFSGPASTERGHDRRLCSTKPRGGLQNRRKRERKKRRKKRKNEEKREDKKGEKEEKKEYKKEKGKKDKKKKGKKC